MEETTKRIAVPPIVFELLGLVLIFSAYLSAGEQNRVIPTPISSSAFVFAILGIALCCWAIVLRGKDIFERKLSGKRVFFDGVDALIIPPFMLVVGVRILKVKGSFCLMFGCSPLQIPSDIFNTLSWILVVLALVTGVFGSLSIFLESKV